jgi:hypothetical protein
MKTSFQKVLNAFSNELNAVAKRIFVNGFSKINIPTLSAIQTSNFSYFSRRFCDAVIRTKTFIQQRILKAAPCFLVRLVYPRTRSRAPITELT